MRIIRPFTSSCSTFDTCTQRDFGLILRSIHVEVLDIGELCALIHTQTGNDGNLLLSFLERGYGHAADPRTSTKREPHRILVTPARLARSGSTVNVIWALGSPHSFRVRSAMGIARKMSSILPASSSEGLIVCFFRETRSHRRCWRVGSRLGSRSGWSAVDEHPARAPGTVEKSNRLQLLDKLGRNFLISHFNQDLRVVELLRLRRSRKPEPWPTPSDERGHIA